MKRSCGECAKLRTNLCIPDQCVTHNYKNFSQKKPWKRCERCGGPMRRIRTDPHLSKYVVKTKIVCADCQASGVELREWIPDKKE